ncbi:hypothetical protein CVT24_012279 [Panaeolus cyanescens]|uniref:Uncharacterized protein n=1 Tax=Panaeolus cyanescens TaxID=181874 RepID=A0A409X146_9AGAR|nr:hypothetical protein CVT24_012279 [Panaeolus cyanescens]
MTHKYCPAIISASSGVWDIVGPMVIDKDWTPGTPFPASLDEVRAMFKRASPHLIVIIERIKNGEACPPTMSQVLAWLFAFADLFPDRFNCAWFLHTFKAYRPHVHHLSEYYPPSVTEFVSHLDFSASM